ncbi:MAG: hypothetical protein ACK6DQ_12485, partial [Planctomycetota bacterium]
WSSGLRVFAGFVRSLSSLSGLWPSELACRKHAMPSRRALAPEGDLWQTQDQAQHLPSAHDIDSKSYLPLRSCARAQRRAA